MAIWQKIDGIVNAALGFGFTGPVVKKNASINDQLDIRNSADTADGRLHAGIVKAPTLEIEDGTAYKTTLTMASGASTDLTFVLPNSDGNNTDVLTTDGSGNLFWASPAGATANKLSDFDFTFASAASLNLLNFPNNTWLDKVVVDVTEAWNGTNGDGTASVGLAGQVAKYVATADVNLYAIGTYQIDVNQFEASAAQMILTHTIDTAGDASAGVARVVVFSGVPS